MSHPSKISIILVQYNNSADIVKCLESLKQSSYVDFDVVIVDNASNQIEVKNTQQYLETNKSKLVSCLLPLVSNTGYSGGNNVGIKYALEHGAGEILILNPDTVAETNLLEEMHRTMQSDDQIGIVGPVIDEPSTTFDAKEVLGKGTRKVAGGKIEWLKPELKHLTPSEVKPSGVKKSYRRSSGQGSSLRESEAEIRSADDSLGRQTDEFFNTEGLTKNQFLTGACLLIKREVIESTRQSFGVFDERYFLYFEDADLCVRAQKAGYRLAIAENAILHHQVSATTSKLGAARLLRYHYRNAHVFNMKNAPLWAFILLPFWSIGIIIKQLLKLAIDREKLISKEILLGVLDFYRGNFGKI